MFQKAKLEYATSEHYTESTEIKWCVGIFAYTLFSYDANIHYMQLTHLSFLLWSYKNFLHILDTNPLLDIGFANISSYFEGCLFTFLIVSFVGKMFLILMKLNSLSFCFVACAFVLYLRNHCLIQGYEDLFLVFYSFGFYIYVSDSF